MNHRLIEKLSLAMSAVFIALGLTAVIAHWVTGDTATWAGPTLASALSAALMVVISDWAQERRLTTPESAE